MNTARTWLSIVIPAYNVELYLQECLASIASQLMPGVEVICIEDASSDGTARLLDEAKATILNHMVVIKHNENKGLSYARNTGLDRARGDYIWFIDSDDIVTAGAIKALQKIIRKHAPDLVLCDHEIYRPSMPLTHDSYCQTFPGPSGIVSNDIAALVAGVFRNGHMHTWSKVAKRSIWEKSATRFPVDRYFEDVSTTPRILFHASSYIHINQAWIKYRQREGSILSKMDKKKCMDIMFAFTDWSLPEDLNTPTVQLPVSEFMFNMFRGACGTLEQVNLTPDTAEIIIDFVKQFELHSPLPPKQIFLKWLFKGRIKHARRNARWYYKTKSQHKSPIVQKT